MPGMTPMASSCYSRDNIHKKSAPEPLLTGWSFFTLALLVVTGSLTIIVALSRFGGFSNGQGMEEPMRGQDYTRKLEARPTEVMRIESPVQMESPAPPASASPGFFFDISYSSSSVRDSTYGKLLEKKGWNGVCVVPFAGELSGRKCKVISSPVSGKSGEQVEVEDCSSSQPQTLANFPFVASESPCSSTKAKSLGITDLLMKIAPPQVIDSVLLNTKGKELDILNNFPFHEYCARSWTVLHNYDKDNMFSIRQLLEVAQGCRVREGAGEYFARCPCDKKGTAVAATGIVSKETLK
jgi:hypothetical protein